jgi:crossover junction endodeoxyribonuclease RuvC
MKVLGIDPGTLILGWGLIELDNNQKVVHVKRGCISGPKKGTLFERLHAINVELGHLIQQEKPQVASIEKIFLGKNVDSAFKLGHVRGICAAQCIAGGAEIKEYAARTVKKQVTGSGSASKEMVKTFLYQQLGLRDQGLPMDASDALALAFCHVLHHSVNRKQRGMEMR